MRHITEEGKPILAWISVKCPYCGSTEQIEVTEKDGAGKHVVRCVKCKERIYIPSEAEEDKEMEKFLGDRNIHSVNINEQGVKVNDAVNTKK
jgi:sarcosine oxidase delta subunit